MLLYDKNYLNKTEKQKNRTFFILIALILIFLITATIIIILNSLLPYNDDRQPILKNILIVFSIVFTLFICFFYFVKQVKINNYYAFLLKIFSSKKSIITITVLEVDKTLITKDKVDCYLLTCLTWSDLANDFVKQNVYIDAEFSNLKFIKGEILNFKISSNFLIEFEEINNETN